ncbi:GDP-L-fucose synthase [Kaistella sp. PBT33-4]|uniref:GDP-L-fucose synthase family protein n=1 Tax=Kaistella sp. PBT33-4 TaxID=3032000 RepID=UPI0023D80E60|nr:GDP-L-fucose synthase [Kaistella sp. PBT33-4]MDF0718809.1 GDP-L-fucose synthase [Kaistella sp. PBT33-4]
MKKDSKIYVAGHRGLVGSAIWNNLQNSGFTNLTGRTSKELDLLDAEATRLFFEDEKPEYVFLAAAHVGGIMANNTYRADFIYKNLQIQQNVIYNSYTSGVKKLLFLGSTCIYPKEAQQPISEDQLLTNTLEYSNEPYAIAKIAGIKMCESFNLQYGTNFISVMPTNLYGPNDNFDLEKSHVLPAMIRKMHLAMSLARDDWEMIRRDLNTRPVLGTNGQSSDTRIQDVLAEYGIYETHLELWGTGNPMREFLWSEDMAEACVFVMQNVDFAELYSHGTEIRNTHLNIGTGTDISIRDLSGLVAREMGYDGNIIFNPCKPDGTMRKLIDVSKIHSLGWKHTIAVEQGVTKMYRWYMENLK